MTTNLRRPAAHLLTIIDPADCDWQLDCPLPMDDTEKRCASLLQCDCTEPEAGSPCPDLDGPHCYSMSGLPGVLDHGCWLVHGDHTGEAVAALALPAGRYLVVDAGEEDPRLEVLAELVDDMTHLIGIADKHIHAVPCDGLIVVPGPAGVRHRRLAAAVCGAAVTAMPDRGAFRLDDPDLTRSNACPACTWTVALEQGATTAALDLFAPEPPADRHIFERLLPGSSGLLRELCTKILAAAGDPPGYYPLNAQLLAHATAHRPEIRIPELCHDHDRGPDGACVAPPEAELGCAACSVLAGAWAGEWAGDRAVQCMVSAPCDALRALCQHFEVVIGQHQAPMPPAND